MIGLRRGTVNLINHQIDWEESAGKTIIELRNIFKSNAVMIEHVGSAAIRNIKAKPIIDIAIGVSSFENLSLNLELLEKNGYQKRVNRFSKDFLYVLEMNNVRTHQIHITLYNGKQWHHYVDFKKYLNDHPEKAKEYEELKMNLVKSCDNDQKKYTDGKQQYMIKVLAEANIYAKKNSH